MLITRWLPCLLLEALDEPLIQYLWEPHSVCLASPFSGNDNRYAASRQKRGCIKTKKRRTVLSSSWFFYEDKSG